MKKILENLNLLQAALKADGISEPFKSQFKSLLSETKEDLAFQLMRKCSHSVTPLIAFMSSIEADLKSGKPTNGKMEAWMELIYSYVEAAQLFKDCKGNLEFNEDKKQSKTMTPCKDCVFMQKEYALRGGGWSINGDKYCYNEASVYGFDGLITDENIDCKEYKEES